MSVLVKPKEDKTIEGQTYIKGKIYEITSDLWSIYHNDFEVVEKTEEKIEEPKKATKKKNA